MDDEADGRARPDCDGRLDVEIAGRHLIARARHVLLGRFPKRLYEIAFASDGQFRSDTQDSGERYALEQRPCMEINLVRQAGIAGRVGRRDVVDHQRTAIGKHNPLPDDEGATLAERHNAVIAADQTCPLRDQQDAPGSAPEYYRAAMRPIDELKTFSAGKAWSDHGADARQDGVTYYYDHMQKLSNRMFNAVEAEPAVKKIAKLGPLIRQAIDKDVPLNVAGECQLGYYMDKLTGAMVRGRQFAEAATALAEYFNLPDVYRTRSAASEEKVLRSRLVRCQRNAVGPRGAKM